jgi:hypothetical protein
MIKTLAKDIRIYLAEMNGPEVVFARWIILKEGFTARREKFIKIPRKKFHITEPFARIWIEKPHACKGLRAGEENAAWDFYG